MNGNPYCILKAYMCVHIEYTEYIILYYIAVYNY